MIRFAIWSSIGRAQEDDPLVEQSRVDVERALSTRGLLDDHRDEWAHLGVVSHTGSLLLPGVRSFAAVSGFSFSGVQMLSRASGELDGDRLDVFDDSVEGFLQSQVGSQALVAAGRPRAAR